MKKIIPVFVLICALFSGLLGSSIMNTMANESQDQINTYYKTISIKEGDCLWTIAEEYAPDAGMSTSDYVSQLMKMNSLSEDTIHTGRNLVIMYRTPADS